MNKKVTFLLGAGFSVPAGYPTAARLGKMIENVDFSSYCIFSNEDLMRKEDVSNKLMIGEVPEKGDHNSYALMFMNRIIRLYVEKIGNKNINYEILYDWLRYDAKDDQELVKLMENSKKEWDKEIEEVAYKEYEETIKDDQSEENIKLAKKNCKEKVEWDKKKVRDKEWLWCAKRIYNKMVLMLLEEHRKKKGKKEGILKYKDFIKLMSSYLKNDISIYTLNHDLLLEEILRELSTIKLDDGFRSYNHKYRCVDNSDGEKEKDVAFYTDERIFPSLHKIHGSKNYHYCEGDILKLEWGMSNNHIINDDGYIVFGEPFI